MRTTPSLCLFLLLATASCSTHPPGRDQIESESDAREAATKGYRLPPRLEDGWQTATPEDVGLTRAPLEEMTQALRQDRYPNVHAVLIAKDDCLVYEAYFEGTDRRYGSDGNRHTVELRFDRDTLHDIRSVGKSVTSAVVGIAVDSGAIESVHQPVSDFFADQADLATPGKHGITLEHLLTMTAGLHWNEGEVPYTNPENHEIQMAQSADPGRFVLRRPLAAEPGERWYYNSGLPTLLGLAVSHATERPFGAFARERLFDPLGIERIEWGGPAAWADIPQLHWESQEVWARAANPAGSLWIRPRDLLKFGSLYLNGGRWKDRQILSEKWVDASLGARVAKPESLREHGEGVTSRASYGYLWHHDRYTLPYGEVTVHAAYGNGGQRIWIVPRLNLVAVHLTGNYNIWTSGWNAEQLLLERILPWALGIPASYQHELARPALAAAPGEWPRLDLSPHQRALYVGVYEEGGVMVRIREEAGKLRMMLPGTSGVDLVPESEHTFALGRLADGVPSKIFWPDHRMVFIPNDAGEIERYEARAVSTGKAAFVGVRVRPPAEEG